MKWAPRTTKYKTERQNKLPILTKSGDLHDSIAYKKEPGIVKVFSDLIYAKVHNEGLKAGRGKGFMMPKRQFMGKSVVILKRIVDKSKREIIKIISSH